MEYLDDINQKKLSELKHEISKLVDMRKCLEQRCNNLTVAIAQSYNAKPFIKAHACGLHSDLMHVKQEIEKVNKQIEILRKKSSDLEH